MPRAGWRENGVLGETEEVKQQFCITSSLLQKTVTRKARTCSFWKYQMFYYSLFLGVEKELSLYFSRQKLGNV